MIHYNLHQLNIILRKISVLTNTNVSFYDENREPSPAFMSNNSPVLCEMFKSKLYPRCLKSDQMGFDNLSPNANAYYYTCHLGLIELLFRIIDDEKNVGYILMGPFRWENKKEENLQKLEEISLSCGFNFTEVKQKYLQIPIFNHEKFEAIQDIIVMFTSKLSKDSNILLMNNWFATVFEPFVNNNIKQELSIKFLCKNFFMSQKRLNNLIKNETGLSPKKYINKQRILIAKKLIISTDMSLQRISEEVGINDYNYFSRLFKSITGKKPSDYRYAKN